MRVRLADRGAAPWLLLGLLLAPAGIWAGWAGSVLLALAPISVWLVIRLRALERRSSLPDRAGLHRPASPPTAPRVLADTPRSWDLRVAVELNLACLRETLVDLARGGDLRLAHDGVEVLDETIECLDRLFEPAPQPAPILTSILTPTPPARTRVLVVDDEPMLLRAYQRILEDDHEVVLAEGGPAGLAQLRRAPDGFDVIVLDLTMPQVDGIGLYRHLEGAAPRLLDRVIFATGGALDGRAQRFLASLSLPVLEKPIEPEVLRRAVQRASDCHLSSDGRVGVVAL